MNNITINRIAYDIVELKSCSIEFKFAGSDSNKIRIAVLADKKSKYLDAFTDNNSNIKQPLSIEFILNNHYILIEDAYTVGLQLDYINGLDKIVIDFVSRGNIIYREEKEDFLE